MELTLIWAALMAATTVVVAIATLRLSYVIGEPRTWRSLVPFTNILLLARLLGIDHGIAVISALLVIFLSPTLVFVLPFLAGRYAVRTGRRRWLGWILSLRHCSGSVS
jgi:hypothetical protein